MSSPTIDQCKVVEQILCYLKGAPPTVDYGQKIECFSISYWIGSKIEGQVYCVFLVKYNVSFLVIFKSWQSKKQNVVSRSSVE